jgi:cell fate regulator YaaT (PSP1 superfamily)
MACNGCASRGLVDKGSTSVFISEGYTKLTTNDWLSKYEDKGSGTDYAEIQFKNTRKEFFLNANGIPVKKGDLVAVEAQFGHDIGTVTLTNRLAWFQIKRKKIDLDRYEFRKIYRKASTNDIEKWKQAMELEHAVMLRTRKIVRELGLDMKVGDVEYQGDGSKAIFYYIAEERIDFRELIKILAREFRIRVEMKQIGARQEAGRIGGIGSCGRELCCSSWKTEFNSVTLNAAKVQELPPNVQKLAGQCGKLKCCLMYELDTYLEAREEIPKVLLELETANGIVYHHKTDILKRIMYYSFDEHSPENLIPVHVDRVKEIINLNKKGVKVELLSEKIVPELVEVGYTHEADDIKRFDRKRSHRVNKKQRPS